MNKSFAKSHLPHGALLAATLIATSVFAATPRELTGSIDAKALKALRLDSRVGSIEVTVGAADQVKWTVRLEPDDGSKHWFGANKDVQAAIDGAKVRGVAAGDAWELAIEVPHGADLDDIQEHWTVEVPARFALEVESNVGEVHVTGMAGGVEAKLNVGELHVDVPKGDVHAKVNVGEVRIISQTKSVGRADLESNVGSVDLRIAGKRIESDSFFQVGGGVRSVNPGEDDFDARVNVGEVTVRVE